jgi:hypothetical protein
MPRYIFFFKKWFCNTIDLQYYLVAKFISYKWCRCPIFIYLFLKGASSIFIFISFKYIDVVDVNEQGFPLYCLFKFVCPATHIISYLYLVKSRGEAGPFWKEKSKQQRCPPTPKYDCVKPSAHGRRLEGKDLGRLAAWRQVAYCHVAHSTEIIPARILTQ